ncbi:MAG: DNA translocase FtsK [Candidatus Gracilibacteria bacterium]|nr:DNA translocase FtsK [Candidatus Gracilibacteria bacterium]
MAKKKKQSANYKIPKEQKKAIIALVLFSLSLMTLFIDTNSVIGSNMYSFLSAVFGSFYKVIFSPILFLLSIFLFKRKDLSFNSVRFVGLILFFLSITSLVGSIFSPYDAILNFYGELFIYFGQSTTIIFSVIILFLSILITFKLSFADFLEGLLVGVEKVKELKKEEFEEKKSKNKLEKVSKEKNHKEDSYDKKKDELQAMIDDLKKQKESTNKKQMTIEEAPKKIPVEKKGDSILGNIFGKKDEETKKIAVAAKKEDAYSPDFSKWVLPSLDLLKTRIEKVKTDENSIKQKMLEIQQKLLQFKIDVTMEDYRIGPTVVQYRLKPKEGIKLNKIENLKKDLTLALHAKSIRIQAPIPGEGVVGIEVPNENRQVVSLKEILASREFNDSKLELPIAMGKDVNGDIIVGDLTKMPHLLVAGQTASGKSVGMNGFLISLLYKFSPSELKMIMVDPKMVELSIYNGIPHLLCPVVTNPDKATNALKWAVAEMLRRYDLAKQINARNLKEYNAKVKGKDKLPYIVIVIDELADLMMSGNKKEVEGSIARIAQMARAVGMHLIVATQRPSVDVITGLIKANIPSRIAFTVASQIDSRTIIDRAGAEDLLGRGDMLYYPTGRAAAARVQGVLVETDEIEDIVNHIKLTVDPDLIENMYDNSIMNGTSTAEGSLLEGMENSDEDPKVLEEAIKVLKEAGKASTSLIQRRLKLGYGRAARVLDILEEMGIVGPANGSKPREVFIKD